MKILIIWICSFLIAGIIISPFFWLRFLKEKSKLQYLFLSFVMTMILYLLYVYFGYGFINNWTAKTNADLYYIAYDFTDYASYLVLLFFILAPFVFTRIIFGSIKIKSFFISLIISVIIFTSIFLFWVYVLLPVAFSQLHNYL